MTSRIAADRARELVEQIFVKYGFSESESTLIADTLIDADLRGIESHGIQRLKMYRRKILAGNVIVGSQAETVINSPVVTVIDAHHGMGQLVAAAAMNAAIAKAKKNGLAITVVRNSNHFGAAGYYSRLASQQKLIGVSMTNTNPILVPTHAKTPFLGSNPIAFAMPTNTDDLVFDAATSIVSYGKIEILKRQQKSISGQWAINKKGNVDDDPNEIIAGLKSQPRVGGILPIGGVGELNSGYKGYGISMIVEILTSILAQGTLSADQEQPGKQGISQFFLAIDPGAFGDPREIQTALAEMLERLRQLPSGDGQQVIVPGDKEMRNYHRNLNEGIPVETSTLDEIRSIAEELKITF